jgi:pimeloyl-ACP methyl ester carboxylesterase
MFASGVRVRALGAWSAVPLPSGRGVQFEGKATVPFAEVGDARLFYTDEGNGDPSFLLVHGWTCDSHDWSWQFDAFAEAHRVVAPDNRGHGRSSITADGYTPHVFALDMVRLW